MGRGLRRCRPARIGALPDEVRERPHVELGELFDTARMMEVDVLDARLAFARLGELETAGGASRSSPTCEDCAGSAAGGRPLSRRSHRSAIDLGLAERAGHPLFR